MSKARKKRNKKYTGRDAKTPDMVEIHRVSAVVRSPRRQWLFEHKTMLRRVGIGLIIGIVIGLVVVGLVTS
jgi:hypothetical protein